MHNLSGMVRKFKNALWGSLQVISLGCLIGCASFTDSDRKQAILHLQIGTQELQQGAYPQALASLLKAESLDPKNPEIQNNLGLAYFVREKYALAEKHIRRALQLRSDYSDAHNSLGRVLIEESQFDEAINELKVAEADLTYTSPERPLINLGLAYFHMKSYDLAGSYFLRALNIQRDNCIAHAYLGRSYYEIKSYKKSADELDRAVAFCQNALFDEPHYYSALSYYEIGKVDKAQARLEELIRLYPDGKYHDKAKSMLEIMRK